ncbi:hypothetical protein BCR37DRAFT_401971 [Protomyces lactucae-debilis]|uniref:DUF1264-domain-containing protein n=1 Tax=Protomyces lactucae-debilis TaxID=2754530 RepID=A0A1Y2FQR9_PROLT|nr:uncharacterized protein BCR37DRAFT_401971 [Protomyces lactucae-debilis]ORY86333.1 hypothetical protein BCR37DRAFT_401971 [Protomyces lactucae-debilis]
MSNLAETAREAVTSATQSFTPLKSVCVWLNGFHIYADDLHRNVEANHYCSQIKPDLKQCLLYDSSDKDARLIGVEYMIPIERFETLPPDEKKLWHTHFCEVKCGILTMPKPTGVPSAVWEASETAEMKELVKWVGKTYHFWQVDRGDALPLGEPKLMMSINSEEQLDLQKIKLRDDREAVDRQHKCAVRKDIQLPEAPIGADAFNNVKFCV